MSHETGRDATTGPGGRRVDRYAADHGLQVATVRKRIQRGQLAGYKGADHRWYVVEDAPPSATPGETRDRTGQDTRQDRTAAVAVNANARAQLEAIRDEWLQPLVETISQQAERLGRLEAERDSVGAQLAAKDETIAELRRRAEAAEAELLRQRNNQGAPQASQDGAGSPETPIVVQGATPGVWGRLRCWWQNNGG